MAASSPTPPGIAGKLPSRSSRSRDGQLRQAREKLDQELGEEGPTSNIRAFVNGFTAAATGSLVVGGINEAMFGRGARKAALATLQDTSRLAQYLEEFHGKPKKVAAEEAARIERLLQSPAKWAFETNAQRVLREVGGLPTPGAPDRPMNVFSLSEGNPGVAKADIVRSMHAMDIPSAVELSPEVPRAAVNEYVMGPLRRRYKTPATAALRAKVWARRLAPLAVAAAPLSLYGGFDAVRRNMDQKRRGKKKK